MKVGLWIGTAALFSGCMCSQTEDTDTNATGETGQIPIPATPDELEGSFVDVALSQGHRCGLRDDGSLGCWATAVNEFFTAQTYLELDSGEGQLCGVTDTHGVRCLSAASGSTSETSLTPPGPDAVLEDFSAGTDFAEWCAIVSGTARCDINQFPEEDRVRVVRSRYQACAWGDDGLPICEQDDYFKKYYPKLVLQTLDTEVALLDAELSPRLCTIDLDGALECLDEADQPWGAVPAGVFERVWTAASHACARSEAGELSCWGADASANAPSGSGFGEVSMLGDEACAVGSDQRITCWSLDG
ncbi:MAG: hypothetical protein KTR31_38725 [Myxococcales bacterium]|nr:hypothetical protein [Myxococcales bacterium]